MRARSLTANNFKSLVDFELGLAKLTCLIGLNGSGKSTVLQFIDFLGQQVRGELDAWLKERSWHASDLHSHLTSKRNIDFRVEITDDSGGSVGTWQASFNTAKLHCTSELLTVGGARIEVQDGAYTIHDTWPSAVIVSPGNRSAFSGHLRSTSSRISLRGRTTIAFSYQGSILSQLKEETLPPPLLEFKRFFQNCRSLDLLSPEQLRQRTRESEGSLGLGGRRLSAFLHELGERKRSEIGDDLRHVYQQLEELIVKPLRSGWKQLEIRESYGEKQLVTEARHISDGMLRLIAILSELASDHRLVLFDEIENGINPELVEFIIEALTRARQQVVVTTHSPMILNYLSDDLATTGVMYLYRSSEGSTKAVPFFSIPSLAEKLKVMGPGEAFVDTDLTALADEIAQVAPGP